MEQEAGHEVRGEGRYCEGSGNRKDSASSFLIFKERKFVRCSLETGKFKSKPRHLLRTFLPHHPEAERQESRIRVLISVAGAHRAVKSPLFLLLGKRRLRF